MPASSSTFHLISSQTFNTARSSKKLQINSSSGAEERRRRSRRSSDIIIINREGENMRPHEEYPKKLSNGSSMTTIGKLKKQQERGVRYRECRKNHAANIGGYAVDGCREFMASGEEGTSAALRCAACSCHRNFHKREVENDDSVCDCSSISTSRS